MSTDRTRIESFLPLRPVEFHILLSLVAGDRHGYGIIQDIQSRGEAAVPNVGTMYRALARLVDSGLIESAPANTGAARSSRGGTVVDDRRINYRVTTLGRRVVKAEAQRLESLARAARLSGLLEKKA
jgi:DNA-binding PadR family transcriptional regulator